jgi:hypothetical protein
MKIVTSRLGIGLGTTALGVSALVAGLIVPATTASASPANHGFWNYIWKPGAALPKIAAGEKLVAWPVYAPGTTPPAKDPPMVPIATTTATGKIVLTASPAAIRKVTSDGTVNLLAQPQGCVVVSFKNEGKKLTGVGEAFSTTKAAQLIFSYTRSQDSSLEVGLSASGSNDWSGDGSIGVSGGSSGTQFFGVQNHVNRDRYLTDFRYGRWHYECSSKLGSTNYYLVAAYEWGAGAGYSHPAAPKASHGNCVHEPKGDGFSLSSTTAIQFSAGFSVLGFTGSAQTGYDTNASITIDFPFGNGWMCGLDDLPGGSHPKVLFAQAKG